MKKELARKTKEAKKFLWNQTKTEAQWKLCGGSLHFQIPGRALNKSYGASLDIHRKMFSDPFWARLKRIYNTSTIYVPSLYPDSNTMYVPALMGRTLHRRIKIKISDAHNKKWTIFTLKSEKLNAYLNNPGFVTHYYA